MCRERWLVLGRNTVVDADLEITACFRQGFGSGCELDPDSIRSVDPDPYSESGSGSRRAKITHKS